MSDEGATKVQNPAASDAQTIGIKGDSPRTRVRIPLGSPANSPAISATAAPVGAALPPQGGTPGANAPQTRRRCVLPRGHVGGHWFSYPGERWSESCLQAEPVAEAQRAPAPQGAEPVATPAAPVAGSPLVVPGGIACVRPDGCNSPRACTMAGGTECLQGKADAFLVEPLTLYAVRSTSEPGLVSIRVAPGDRTATPLYEELTRRFRAGDVLELRLVHRPRGGK